MKHKENRITHFLPSPAQLRAARAVLGWLEDATAAKAGISVEQLRIIEHDPRGGEGLFQLEHVLRCAGIEFQRLSGLDGGTDRIAWRKRGPIRPANTSHVALPSPENDTPQPAIVAKVFSQ